MDVPIIRPLIYEQVSNQGLNTLLGGDDGYTIGANTNYESSFINIDANQAMTPAIAVGANAVSAGASPTAWAFLRGLDSTANAATKLAPPYVMHGDTNNSGATFKARLWPHSIRGVRFAMNITGTTFQIGTANSAPALDNANCIVGKQLPLIVGGTTNPGGAGAYAGVFAVNVGSTSNPMVRIVDIPKRFKGIQQNGTLSTYFNGIVIVEFLDTVIASL